jgi:hypothetical protein
MSSATFDPHKFKVEDLFRAKKERRQRLARLPFEEKIKIVERLQTSVAAAQKNEKLIFESFLKACPDFAGEPIEAWDVVEEWYGKRALEPPPHPFDKRPDVIALTASGKKIGIELKSWVNRDQIAEARKQERIQDNILEAIGEQPPNQTQHMGYVWLSAKEVRFDSADTADFREQIFALIEQVDHNWSEEFGLRECSHDVTDFTRFPILERYLQRVRCAPRPHFETDWIHFPSPGGAYSPNEMLETLKQALFDHRRDEKYRDLRKHVGLDEVYLLVHYDFKAFAYNTPFDAPGFGFREAAKFAENELGGDGGYFDRIFLFHFLWGKEEAYKIHPRG